MITLVDTTVIIDVGHRPVVVHEHGHSPGAREGALDVGDDVRPHLLEGGGAPQHIHTRMSQDNEDRARREGSKVHEVWCAMSTTMEGGPPHLAGCEGPCDVSAEVWPVALAEVPPTDQPQLLRPAGILGLVQTNDKGKGGGQQEWIYRQRHHQACNAWT